MMAGCEHWNIVVMVKQEDEDAKLCHVYYDGEYQETYAAEANEADRDIEIWCDDCETLFSYDRDDLPAWVQVAVTDAERDYAAAD
jgi:hypothetical protein